MATSDAAAVHNMFLADGVSRAMNARHKTTTKIHLCVKSGAVAALKMEDGWKAKAHPMMSPATALPILQRKNKNIDKPVNVRPDTTKRFQAGTAPNNIVVSHTHKVEGQVATYNG